LLPTLGCHDPAAAPSVSRAPLDICAGKMVALDLVFTVREVSPTAGLVPSALLPMRFTFHPDAAPAGAAGAACAASGTVTTSKPLPLAGPAGAEQRVTFRALMEDGFGGLKPVVYIEQGYDSSTPSPSSFQGILFVEVASGLWSASAGPGESARGDFRTY
jgi:hypothetical protein